MKSSFRCLSIVENDRATRNFYFDLYIYLFFFFYIEIGILLLSRDRQINSDNSLMTRIKVISFVERDKRVEFKYSSNISIYSTIM